MKIYIIGSLRNPKIPEFANRLVQAGYDAFADWYAAGPNADDCWRDYAKLRGWDYPRALRSHAARNVFDFDRRHLDLSDCAVMLAPAGKSGHLELGYMRGRNKPTYILFGEEPERYDVMANFATDIFLKEEDLMKELSIQSILHDLKGKYARD